MTGCKSHPILEFNFAIATSELAMNCHSRFRRKMRRVTMFINERSARRHQRDCDVSATFSCRSSQIRHSPIEPVKMQSPSSITAHWSVVSLLICSGNSKSPAKHRGCGACPTRDRWSVTFSRLLPGVSDQQPNGPEGAAHDSFLTPFPGCRLTRGRPGRCLGLTCHGPSGRNTNNVGLSGGKHSAAPVGHGLNSFSLIDQERNSKNPISKAGH